MSPSLFVLSRDRRRPKSKTRRPRVFSKTFAKHSAKTEIKHIGDKNERVVSEVARQKKRHSSLQPVRFKREMSAAKMRRDRLATVKLALTRCTRVLRRVS